METKPEAVTPTRGIVRIGDVWRVAEIVTPEGHWITWSTAYATPERAREAALRGIDWPGH